MDFNNEETIKALIKDYSSLTTMEHLEGFAIGLGLSLNLIEACREHIINIKNTIENQLQKETKNGK